MYLKICVDFQTWSRRDAQRQKPSGDRAVRTSKADRLTKLLRNASADRRVNQLRQVFFCRLGTCGKIEYQSS